MREFVWHHTRTSCRIRVEVVLVDTGAGGGNYSSATFVRSGQRSGYGGESIMNPRRQEWVKGVNPTSSVIPLMKMSGSCELPLVFSPNDSVRKALVRGLGDLSYGES